MLQPGVCAPDFTLPAVNSSEPVSLAQLHGRPVALVFFPSEVNTDLASRLAAFAKMETRFEELDAAVIGVSDAPISSLQRLAERWKIGFPLLSDSSPPGKTSAQYGVVAPGGEILPAVFVADAEGLIRRVYEATRYPTLPNPAMVARAIRKLRRGPKPALVTPEDWQLGPPDAPVTLIEYSDYQCGRCIDTFRLLQEILPLFEDKVRLVHRHLPLRHSHPLAQLAAEAAEAAGAQGKFWDMHRRLFEARGALERDQLITYAQEIGLDMERFIDDLESRRFRDAVNQDFKQAVRNGIKLPPALFINGIPFEGPRTREALCAKIDGLLASTAPADLKRANPKGFGNP